MRAVSSETVNTARSATGLPGPQSALAPVTLPLPSRERAGVRVPQCLGDPLEDALYVRERLVIPEAQDSIALRFEKSGALRIGWALERMLHTVELNDHLRLGAAEVDDV